MYQFTATLRTLPAVIGACLALAAGSARAAHLAFTPDSTRPAPAIAESSEGCGYDPGVAQGTLTASSGGADCRSGLAGSVPAPEALAVAPAESVAAFETAALASAATVGGRSTLVLYFWSEAATGGDATAETVTLAYALREKNAAGALTTIAAGTYVGLPMGFHNHPARVEFPFDIPAYTLQPGSTLQVLLSTGAPDGRIFYGGQFSDAGLDASGDTNGTLANASNSKTGGAIPQSVLLALLTGFSLRRRKPHEDR